MSAEKWPPRIWVGPKLALKIREGLQARNQIVVLQNKYDVDGANADAGISLRVFLEERRQK
jgi:hypothetical protein